MNRRAFIHSVGIAALATAALAAAPKRRLKIGFLGIAHSHGPAKLKTVQESDDWELVGLAEADAELREKFGKDGVALRSAEELFRAAEVIAVESANADHFRHAQAALKAGCHVHLEKPPAISAGQFQELLKLAAQRKRLLQMGYMWRYHPGFERIFEAVRNGWLGEISLVRATMNSHYASSAQRRGLESLPGGGMMELGCHVIDQMVRLLGTPTAVSTTHRTHGAADQLVDNSVAIFDFPKALGIVHINLLQSGASAHRTFEVIGTKGTATLQPIEPPVLQLNLAEAGGPYRKGRQTIELPKYQRYVPELADLAEAIRSGRSLAVTPEEDLRVQEWLLRACA